MPWSLDDDRLVAHRRDVRAARRARAHDGRDLRDAGGGHRRLVEEDPAEVLAVGEDLVLQRQVGAAGVDEVDARQAVVQRDLLRAQVLLDRQREVRAALDRRVVGDDHDLAPVHAPDARRRSRRPARRRRRGRARRAARARGTALRGPAAARRARARAACRATRGARRPPARRPRGRARAAPPSPRAARGAPPRWPRRSCRPAGPSCSRTTLMPARAARRARPRSPRRPRWRAGAGRSRPRSRHRRRSRGRPGPSRSARRRACGSSGARPSNALDVARDLDERAEVDAGRDAHLVQHPDEVLGRDVARRARRDGAAAELADA